MNLLSRRVMAAPAFESTLGVRPVSVLLAVVVGVLAGVLGYLADHNLPSAVLIGGGAAANALLLCHTLLGPGGPNERRP